MLRVHHVSKSYGEIQALRGVDLEIERGQIVALLGPNGAGKTTLVSVIAGLLRADGGSVTVAGLDIAKQGFEVRSRVGFAPQELGIYPSLSVSRNLRFFGELAGLSGRSLNTRIEEVAVALNLAPLMDRPGRDLSGGEKRRLHTGTALLHRPPLLLLDEPTAGADVETRLELLRMVRRLADEGTAICYSTHYMPEAEELGASVAILEQGRMIARGELGELMQAHNGSAVVLGFQGAAPELPPEFSVEGSGSQVRVRAEEPAATLAEVLAVLGPAASRIDTVEIVRPSLESVYRSLTGKQFDRTDRRSHGDGNAA